jgi:hypothetical protein
VYAATWSTERYRAQGRVDSFTPWEKNVKEMPRFFAVVRIGFFPPSMPGNRETLRMLASRVMGRGGWSQLQLSSEGKKVGLLGCDCVLSVNSMDNGAEGYRGLAQHGCPLGWLEDPRV